MKKVKSILKNKKCLKLICAAGNKNLDEIEKLAFIYSAAGFNMIDLCADTDVIGAAKKGINRAHKKDNMLICASVGMPDDIHLSKAEAECSKCVFCGKCAEICPQNAIFIENNKINIDKKKCIGCSKCVSICTHNALFLEHKNEMPHKIIPPLTEEGIDLIEFHCTSSDERKISEEWKEIKKIYSGCLGACCSRSKLGDENIINLINKMRSGLDFFIFQADGNPMTGGDDDYKSTLQTAAFAQIIRNANLDVYLILSGGTNSKTASLAKKCGVQFDGIAFGSYARKLVKKYTQRNDFFENIKIQEEALKKAKNLADLLKE